MRGNEAAVYPPPSHSTSTLFPIPMRGNEEWAVVDHFITSSRFPIPMRGNEHVERRRRRVDVRPFPIPMRGNESWYQLDSSGTAWRGGFRSP